MQHVHQAGTGKAMSADGAVGNAGGVILNKIICTTSTSAILDIYDGVSTAGTKIVDSLTLVAGTVYDLNIAFAAGCYIDLVSGTGKWTAVYL